MLVVASVDRVGRVEVNHCVTWASSSTFGIGSVLSYNSTDSLVQIDEKDSRVKGDSNP